MCASQLHRCITDARLLLCVQAQDAAADVRATGALAVELLTGGPPRRGGGGLPDHLTRAAASLCGAALAADPPPAGVLLSHEWLATGRGRA